MDCAYAIYSVKCVVDSYVSLSSTVNLCALDIIHTKKAVGLDNDERCAMINLESDY